MRRFSSKNHLVTLNEINITPLLDLAFVLLIIFIITTPLLEQSLKLNVPTGGAANSTVRKDQVRTIEVNPKGGYRMKGQDYSLVQVEQMLAIEKQKNAQLAVYVRADRKEAFENVTAVMNVLERLGIKYVKFATSPERK
jgi:biopolymer transport protein ExbD